MDFGRNQPRCSPIAGITLPNPARVLVRADQPFEAAAEVTEERNAPAFGACRWIVARAIGGQVRTPIRLAHLTPAVRPSQTDGNNLVNTGRGVVWYS